MDTNKIKGTMNEIPLKMASKVVQVQFGKINK